VFKSAAPRGLIAEVPTGISASTDASSPLTFIMGFGNKQSNGV
jgi:hypothetical protein